MKQTVEPQNGILLGSGKEQIVGKHYSRGKSVSVIILSARTRPLTKATHSQCVVHHSREAMAVRAGGNWTHCIFC